MLIYRCVVGIILALFMALGGYKKRSLDLSGAVAAFVVGFLTTVAGIRYSLTVILFFVSSSILTKYGGKKKARLEGSNHKEGGQRNWVQVVSNSLPGMIACLLAFVMEPDGIQVERLNLEMTLSPLPTMLMYAFIGHYACCTADTWASELGILSRTPPRLVTAPWRTVPAGTNGGISVFGSAASLVGGLFIGICFFLLRIVVDSPNYSTTTPQWPVILAGVIGGCLGSLIDSLLGATLQYSGWCSKNNCVVEHPAPTVTRISGVAILDNHQVNLMSSLLTAIITPFIMREILSV